MTTPNSKQSATTAEHFDERYGITPGFFVRHCLLPSLSALKRVSCFYRGALVETLEAPAWKPRLRALRTIFAMADAEEIEEKHIKVPWGALGPAQLTVIADAFLETDWSRIIPEFLVADCLKPALDASNNVYRFYRGQLVHSLQLKDMDAQMCALEIAGKIHKLYAAAHNNMHFVNYHDIRLLISDAQRECRAIQIVRQNQYVYMR